MLATKETEYSKVADALEILRRSMNSDENTRTSENTVQKKEKILICGNEVTVRRLYVLYGAYRVGWVSSNIYSAEWCWSDYLKCCAGVGC